MRGGLAVRAASERILPAGGLSGLTDAVLSIGKLAAGQARYYLDQAEGRVDAVESIGDGVEEYYAGGAEARGEWLGSAARRSVSRARSTATRCAGCSPASTRTDGSPLRGVVEPGAGRGVRSDVLGAEERERDLRAR